MIAVELSAELAIGAPWTAWHAQGMARLGIAASKLAGLHVHFIARAAQLMQPGAALCFVSSVEWIDNGH